VNECNLIWTQNQVFAYAIKLRGAHTDPNPMIDVLIRREKRKTTQRGEHCVKTERHNGDMAQ
jgi:hypothetical protein